MGVPAAEDPTAKDGRHLELLSVFHFVNAGLSLLGILFCVVHYSIMNATFGNPAFLEKQMAEAEMPFDVTMFFDAFKWFYLLWAVWTLLSLILNTLAGLYLRRRNHRTFTLGVACFNCLAIPIGTVLGVFTLVVLSRPSVQALYHRE